jgi:predicted Zn-dependent peptidase
MLNGSVKTPDEIVALLEAVTMDDVRRDAARLIDESRLTMALVGPFRSERRFHSLLHV